MLTAAIATYADDATERDMASTSAAAAVTARDRGTENSAHVIVAVTMGNEKNTAGGAKATAASHYSSECSSGMGGREDEHKNIGPSRRVHNGFFLSFRTLYLQSTLTEISVAPPSFSQGAQPSQAHR